jgi:hypothetical protein
VTTLTDTPIYQKQDDYSKVIAIIPSREAVYVDGKTTKKYRKIKYADYVGWALNPQYTGIDYNTNYSRKSNVNRNTSTHSSSKTVNVKGYYRKDGTYVKPHTRSAPRRKS